MNPPEEFLKHAADCEKMARSTRDPRSSATWHRMAERWRQCAEKFTRDQLARLGASPADDKRQRRRSQTERLAESELQALVRGMAFTTLVPAWSFQWFAHA